MFCRVSFSIVGTRYSHLSIHPGMPVNNNASIPSIHSVECWSRTLLSLTHAWLLYRGLLLSHLSFRNAEISILLCRVSSSSSSWRPIPSWRLSATPRPSRTTTRPDSWVEQRLNLSRDANKSYFRQQGKFIRINFDTSGYIAGANIGKSEKKAVFIPSLP